MEPEFNTNNGIYIPHLSPSTVTSFIENRYGFYKGKVLQERFLGNHFTARGKAVEHAVNVWIEEPETKDLLKEAYDAFDLEIDNAGIAPFLVSDTRDSIKGLLEVALKFYKQEFTERPAKTQQKISINIPGIERDIIGYLDFLQDDLVRDSKVVSKTPSALSQAYIIQGSIYRKAMGKNVVFDFFIDNKTPVMKSIQLTDEQYIHGISYFTIAAQTIELIQVCDDPKEMMRLMSFPNFSAMYSKEDKQEAAKRWGITL